MKSLFGNLSPHCSAAEEVGKFCKSGGGWLCFCTLPGRPSLPRLFSFTEVHESSWVAGNGIVWITGGLGATGIKLWYRLSVKKYWFQGKMNLALNQARYQCWRNEGRNYLQLSNSREPGAGLALSLPVVWLVSNCTAGLEKASPSNCHRSGNSGLVIADDLSAVTYSEQQYCHPNEGPGNSNACAISPHWAPLIQHSR